LGAPNRRRSNQILPNFLQNSLAHIVWARYYIGWHLPTDIVSSAPLQSFQILNFYFFSVFFTSVMNDNRHRI